MNFVRTGQIDVLKIIDECHDTLQIAFIQCAHDPPGRMPSCMCPQQKHRAPDPFQGFFRIEVLAQVAIDRGPGKVSIIFGQELISCPHVVWQERRIVRIIGLHSPIYSIQQG